MKSYRCHKIVQAAKIVDVKNPDFRNLRRLTLEDLSDVTVHSETSPLAKAEVGGYYVLYEDGYASYSPAEAFEKGYRELAEDVGEDGNIETLHYYAFQYRNAGSPADAQKAYDDLVEFEKRCIAAACVKSAEDERTPEAVAISQNYNNLILAWTTEHQKPMPWSKSVECYAIVAKLPDEEKQRLLALG